MTEEKKDAMVSQGPGGMMTRPDYIPAGTEGTEHITRDDLTMPRIAIGQGLSHEMLEDDPAFIEGLKLGHMFNNISGQIYGKGPLDFCIVRADPPRGMEFVPLKEGGGVRDFDVALDDPRMDFTTNAEGERKKPIATKFYDFLIVLLPSKEMVALSFKSTGLKVAKKLNSFIKFREADLFMGKYRLSSETKTNAAGTWGVYVVKNAGWIDKDLVEWAKTTFEAMKDRMVVIERGQEEEEQPVDVDALLEKAPF